MRHPPPQLWTPPVLFDWGVVHEVFPAAGLDSLLPHGFGHTGGETCWGELLPHGFGHPGFELLLDLLLLLSISIVFGGFTSS